MDLPKFGQFLFIFQGIPDSMQMRQRADDAKCSQWHLNGGGNWQKLRTKKRGNYRGNGQNRSESSKSEEEAATTIQAMYRGYKTRQTFQQVKKKSKFWIFQKTLKFCHLKKQILFKFSQHNSIF